MNGTANGKLDSKEKSERKSSVGSRIPKLHGKTPRKPPPEGTSGRNQPIEDDNSTCQSINGSNPKFQPVGDNDTKHEPKENGFTNHRFNESNGMLHSSNNDSTNDVTITVDTECSDDVNAHGIPRCFMKKIRHRSGSLITSDGETIDLNCVESTDIHNNNIDSPKGVENTPGIPRCFMEKIRHRSGGTTSDSNGDLSENDELNGVVFVDIEGVDDDNGNGLQKKGEKSDIVVVDKNGVHSNGTVTLEHSTTEFNAIEGETLTTQNKTKEDENVDKKTNRKSKLPTIPKTFVVRRLEKRLSSSDSIDTESAGCSNQRSGTGTAGYNNQLNGNHEDENKKAKCLESKIPVSRATSSVTKTTSAKSKNKNSATSLPIGHDLNRLTDRNGPWDENGLEEGNDVRRNRGDSVSDDCHKNTVTKGQQLPTHYHTSGPDGHIPPSDVNESGRTTKDKQRAKKTNKQNDDQKTSVSKQNGKMSENTSGSLEICNNHQLNSSSGSSFHKMVEKPELEMSSLGEDVIGDNMVQNGISGENESGSQNNEDIYESDRTQSSMSDESNKCERPLEGATSVSNVALHLTELKNSRENLRNLEANFLRSLNQLDQEETREKKTMVLNRNEVSVKNNNNFVPY